MIEDKYNFITQAIQEALENWALSDEVSSTALSQQILSQTVRWDKSLADGSTLMLLRVYSPVVKRREVFLGYALLNDFLFKALPRAVKKAKLGTMLFLLNDLESAYVLWRGSGDIAALRAAYHAEILEALPALYFGEENVDYGIHGDINRMLTFYKSNIEPFPAFVIPHAYLGRLLTEVGKWLSLLSSEKGPEALAQIDHLSIESAASRRINVILSILSFFYSKNGTEMQSFHTFLKQAMEDGRLQVSLTKATFRFKEDETFDKKIFNKRKESPDDLNFDTLERAIQEILQTIDLAVRQGNTEEVAQNLASKTLPLTPETVAFEILKNVWIGHAPTVTLDKPTTDNLACRFCGKNLAIVEEKNIVGGIGTGNYFNQAPKKTNECFCLPCALSSYLVSKRLGMQFDRIFPVPKLYNIVFHYGNYQDWEIEALQRQMDYVLAQTGADKSTEELFIELQQLKEKVAEEYSIIPNFESMDWEAWILPALDIVDQMQKDIQAEVITLGQGVYRLLVFILPQLRPGRDEGLDFVQKRFSRNRLAVYTLLGLLRKLSDSNGPFYFQSLPALTPTQVAPNTFYVNGQAEDADAALQRYGTIASFARRVVKYRRGHSILVGWMLLAEQLERDPLGMFSDVLRRSAIRGGDKSKKATYRRLSNDFVPNMGVVDSKEYLVLFEKLRKMQTNL